MAETIAEQQEVRQTDEGRCRHRWIVQTPNGPNVQGRCKLCGRERTFPTAPERVNPSAPMRGQ